MSGYIYAGVLNEGQLKKLLQDYFQGEQPYHIIQSIKSYYPGMGIPNDFLDGGSVFLSKGEVHWKKNNKTYFVTLLTEQSVTESELALKERDLKVSEQTQMLVSHDATHIDPKFKHYPNDAKTIKICIYKKNEIAIATRLKEF